MKKMINFVAHFLKKEDNFVHRQKYEASQENQMLICWYLFMCLPDCVFLEDVIKLLNFSEE